MDFSGPSKEQPERRIGVLKQSALVRATREQKRDESGNRRLSSDAAAVKPGRNSGSAGRGKSPKRRGKKHDERTRQTRSRDRKFSENKKGQPGRCIGVLKQSTKVRGAAEARA